MAHNKKSWTKCLPVFLLGLRATVKEDLQASSSELVYDTRLQLPSKSFKEGKIEVDPTTFVSNLLRAMEEFCAAQVIRHGQPRMFIN